MDKDLAAKNMRLGALFFVVALIMFGLSFAFAVVFLKGNDAEGQEAVAPTGTAAAEQTPAPQEAPPGEATPPAQVLEIKAVPTFKFDQGELTAKADGQVTIKFTNEDPGVPHNWAVYTDDSAGEAIGGANEGICTGPCSEEITFDLPSPGQYYFRCDVHPTQMEGTFIVE